MSCKVHTANSLGCVIDGRSPTCVAPVTFPRQQYKAATEDDAATKMTTNGTVSSRILHTMLDRSRLVGRTLCGSFYLQECCLKVHLQHKWTSMQYCGNTQPTYIRKWKYSYNMKLMSNTAASYPMGAGRFEPWLFVNCYRVYSYVTLL